MSIPIAANPEASINPVRRPTRRISMDAGIADAATATTISDSGNVTSALLLVSDAPIMPPSVTSDIVAVAEMS